MLLAFKVKTPATLSGTYQSWPSPALCCSKHTPLACPPRAAALSPVRLMTCAVLVVALKIEVFNITSHMGEVLRPEPLAGQMEINETL